MAKGNRFKVIVAERNPLVVTALCEMIKRNNHFELVQSVQTGEAFIKAATEPEPAFDVAVIGWKLSDMDGGEVLAELNRRQLYPRIVIFSNEHDIAILRQCVRMGARGFCYQLSSRHPKRCIDTDVVRCLITNRHTSGAYRTPAGLDKDLHCVDASHVT